MRTTFHYPESPYGRTYADVITKFLGWEVYLSYGVPLARPRSSNKNKKVGLSLMVVMVIVMRMNTIMTDIMRMRKSIILPVGASKYKVDHGYADSRTQEDLLLYTSTACN